MTIFLYGINCSIVEEVVLLKSERANKLLGKQVNSPLSYNHLNLYLVKILPPLVLIVINM